MKKNKKYAAGGSPTAFVLPEPTPVDKAAPEDYEEPDIAIPQLASHDMHIPEEPETVQVVSRFWNGTEYVVQNQGPRMLVPTGCTKPQRASPYETTIKLKSALPRDRQELANLYSAWQSNGWANRHTIIELLEEGLQPGDIDQGILDDIPILNALAGRPDPTAQVAQTEGNGAPPPPGPGPGRGNKFQAGDNLASANPPPNAAPGRGV